jgi:hypothetical protein
MVYNCIRCGYETKHKGHFKNHLNRKKICIPILEDISINDIKNYYNIEIDDNHKKHTINTILTPKTRQLTPKNTENNTTNISNKECPYCCKEFSRVDSLTRHLKVCKSKKKTEKQDKITLLEKEKEELLKTVEKLLIECSIKSNNNTINSNNSNNTNSNNTNNTIIINNYGDENTKYITKEFIVNLLANKPFKAIPEMIKHTHFNKEHPENQNIKITNKKEPYVKIMKDNKWEYQDRKNTITDLIDKHHIKITDEKVEQKVEKHCNSTQKNNIERCNDLYVNEDEDYLKRLYNESELVIINNSQTF